MMGSTMLFLVTNWQLVVAVTLGVLILGAVAWMLKNLWVAVAGAAVLVGYFAYQDAWVKGAEQCRQQVKAAVSAEKDRQRTISDEALENARRLAAERAVQASELQTMVDEYENADDCILDASRARGLHDIR